MNKNKVGIDYSVFLGMHSNEEAIRVKAKNFLCKHLNSSIVMPHEQVGIVDDIIWQFTHEEQTSYYPFLDYIHTELNFIRFPYSEYDYANAKKLDLNISFTNRLFIASMLRLKIDFFTLNDELFSIGKYEKIIFCEKEESFQDIKMEMLYHNSLELSIPKFYFEKQL